MAHRSGSKTEKLDELFQIGSQPKALRKLKVLNGGPWKTMKPLFKPEK